MIWLLYQNKLFLPVRPCSSRGAYPCAVNLMGFPLHVCFSNPDTREVSKLISSEKTLLILSHFSNPFYLLLSLNSLFEQVSPHYLISLHVTLSNCSVAREKHVCFHPSYLHCRHQLDTNNHLFFFCVLPFKSQLLNTDSV